MDTWSRTDISYSEKQKLHNEQLAKEKAEAKQRELPQLSETELFEQRNKSLRDKYLDAYRKYQAAVNYGEIERVSTIDAFIKKLRDKDWTAFENIPPQIKYFIGELGFAESGFRAVEKI